ncbi:MAG: hypothetical protein ACI4WG_00540 [Erysipelotrichaceae bacterium]
MEETNEKKDEVTLTAQRIDEVNEEGTHLTTVMFKNDPAIYVVVVIAIALIVTLNAWGIFFGLFFLAVSLFVIFKIKDYKCFEIYDDAVLIYSDKNDDQVIRIAYDDVKEWTVNNRQQGSNAIVFILNDDKCVTKETFQINKAYKYLTKVMPYKESRVIELNKLRNEKITLENPFKSKKKR